MSMTQVSATVRVEDARRTKTAEATPELLATLDGYYEMYGSDALGGTIRPGEPFTYLDPTDICWRVYQEQDDGTGAMRYLAVTDHDTEAEALAAAEALSGE